MCPFWGVVRKRTVVFGGLYWGLPVYANCHIESGLRFHDSAFSFEVRVCVLGFRIWKAVQIMPRPRFGCPVY